MSPSRKRQRGAPTTQPDAAPTDAAAADAAGDAAADTPSQPPPDTQTASTASSASASSERGGAFRPPGDRETYRPTNPEAYVKYHLHDEMPYNGKEDRDTLWVKIASNPQELARWTAKAAERDRNVIKRLREKMLAASEQYRFMPALSPTTIDRLIEANDGDKENAVATFTTPVPDLPTEVLLMIFAYLGRQSLGRATQVCKAWRAAIITHLSTNGGVWEALCHRAGLIDTVNDSLAAPSKKLVAKVTKIRKKSLTDPRIESAFQEHYKKCIVRKCQHCLATTKQSMEYDLFEGVNLCRTCRNLEPYAFITTTNAKKYFKFGTKVKERAGMARQYINYGSTSGMMYRFSDMVAAAQKDLGIEKAREMEAAARAGLGIYDMKPQHLLDL